MTELMADAKKLTVFNPDGTIKVAGFVPLNQWEELSPDDLANAWGAKWFDSAATRSSPRIQAGRRPSAGRSS